MAIYVDRARVLFKDRVWCHMMADSLDELHHFAQLMKIDVCLFHRTASYPHYDITMEMRERVIACGAVDADRRTIILCGKKLKQQLKQSM